MNPLADVVLTMTGGAPTYASCPDVTIDGFRVPNLLRVVVDTPFDEPAIVTITIRAKVTHK